MDLLIKVTLARIAAVDFTYEGRLDDCMELRPFAAPQSYLFIWPWPRAYYIGSSQFRLACWPVHKRKS